MLWHRSGGGSVDIEGYAGYRIHNVHMAVWAVSGVACSQALPFGGTIASQYFASQLCPFDCRGAAPGKCGRVKQGAFQLLCSLRVFGTKSGVLRGLT